MNPENLPNCSEEPPLSSSERKYRTIFEHPNLEEKIVVENRAGNRAAAIGRACIAVGKGYIFRGSSVINETD